MRRTYDGDVPRRGKHGMAHKKLNKEQRKALRKERRAAARQPDPVTSVGAPSRKHWSAHDLATIRGQNDRQKDALRAWFEGDSLGLLGSAGTGKTFLAFYLASRALTDGEADGIIVARSAVQSRDQGFLPGDLAQKMEPYEVTYRDVMAELFPALPNTYNDMKDAGLIQFESTSFLRGRTFHNKVIIVEEGQNMDFDEIDTLMTRVGSGTRVIVTGDTKRQNDLKRRREVSGLPLMRELVKDVGGFTVVDFLPGDVVRSGFARKWIMAVEAYFARAA